MKVYVAIKEGNTALVELYDESDKSRVGPIQTWLVEAGKPLSFTVPKSKGSK